MHKLDESFEEVSGAVNQYSPVNVDHVTNAENYGNSELNQCQQESPYRFAFFLRLAG